MRAHESPSSFKPDNTEMTQPQERQPESISQPVKNSIAPSLACPGVFFQFGGRETKNPRKWVRAGLLVSAAVLALLIVPGCGDGDDDGNGGGGGDSQTGLDTVPNATDLTIYDGDVASLPFSPWDNTEDGELYSYGTTDGYVADTDGDNQMDAVITGTPGDAERIDLVLELESWMQATNPDVTAYSIIGFDVEVDGEYTGEVDLVDFSALTDANKNDFTGALVYYEFWWVSADSTLTGSGDDEGIPLNLDVEMKAGWNVVRTALNYNQADAEAGSLPESIDVTDGAISPAAIWLYTSL